MSNGVRVWVIWGWALAVVGVLVLNLIAPPPSLAEAWQWIAGNMAFPVAAALILTNRPGNRVEVVAVVTRTPASTAVWVRNPSKEMA